MKPREALAYFTGTDILKERIDRENEMIFQSTGRKDVLPSETDPKTAIKIYANRLLSILIYPAILASRFIGADAAIKIIRKKTNQNNPQ